MEKILFIYRGCPCSGKSYAAQEYKKEHPDVVIANRDTIRYELGNGKYVQDREDDVTEKEVSLVRNAMVEGKTVILDDTNLNPKYLGTWYDLAKEYDYQVETREFYVPYKVAMERSKKRKEEGGLFITKDVMQRFYKRYYKEEFEKEMTDYRVFNSVKWDNKLKTCVICDLDGTFAMHTGRTPFEWDRIPEDQADIRLRLILEILEKYHCHVIFLTGRPDNVRDKTEEWLDDNFDGTYTLIMRESNDWSHGQDTKKKLYEQHIKGKYNVIAVFEDSDKCVNMWRELGLLTLQVQNSHY